MTEEKRISFYENILKSIEILNNRVSELETQVCNLNDKKEITDTERLDFIEKNSCDALCYSEPIDFKWRIRDLDGRCLSNHHTARQAIDAAMRDKDGE